MTSSKTKRPEPRVVTVRMSVAIHAGLCELAHDRRTSVNRQCAAIIARAVKNNEAARLVYRVRRKNEKRKEATRQKPNATASPRDSSHLRTKCSAIPWCH